MILAGDIGGTKSNLGLFSVDSGALVRVAHKRYASHEHSGLHEIAQDFLRQTGAQVTAAAFGIAGPILDNRVKAANLPWTVDAAEMAGFLRLPRVRLLNDLQATAYGVGVLGPADMVTIVPGLPVREATRAVIAAGTGLGESILYWDGGQYVAMPSEAGHADFAPNTDQQADLWKFLKTNNEFVFQELILSGRGFQQIHEFLDSSVRHPGFDGKDFDIDPAAEITQLAFAGSCPVCVNTVNLWTEIYGSEAGNLALRAVARGGIYVAGGIAVKILVKIKEGRFAAAMQRRPNAGGFSLKDVPIHVILDEECPLKGAAYAAWKLS
ncbi:MAG: glucokinase [Acidobacteriota bacterium]|nr:glucokinase [Acidobacteriota bacterium]